MTLAPPPEGLWEGVSVPLASPVEVWEGVSVLLAPPKFVGVSDGVRDEVNDFVLERDMVGDRDEPGDGVSLGVGEFDAVLLPEGE
jgi:hypothetical protein